MADHGCQVGITLNGCRNVGERSEGQDGQFLRRGADFVADHFVGRVAVVQFGDIKAGVTQAVGAVDCATIC